MDSFYNALVTNIAIRHNPQTTGSYQGVILARRPKIPPKVRPAKNNMPYRKELFTFREAGIATNSIATMKLNIKGIAQN